MSETIFLQNYKTDFRDVTWAEERVNETDIEYILKSKYDELEEENNLLNDYIRDQESDIDERNDLIRELEKEYRELKAKIKNNEENHCRTCDHVTKDDKFIKV